MVTVTKIVGVKPYKLRMACGHLEIRMMSESTAGVAYAPDVIKDVETSECAECEPSKAELREGQRYLNEKYGLTK